MQQSGRESLVINSQVGNLSPSSGTSQLMTESFGYMIVSLILAVVLVYMILAAQFESFIHPVTIMLALPLTIPCGLAGLVLLNEPMNIYSVFGFFVFWRSMLAPRSISSDSAGCRSMSQARIPH